MENSEKEELRKRIKALKAEIKELEAMLKSDTKSDEQQISIDELEKEKDEAEEKLEEILKKEIEKLNEEFAKMQKNIEMVKATLVLSTDIEKIDVTETLKGLTDELKELDEMSNQLSSELESFASEINSEELKMSSKEIKRRATEFKTRLKELKILQVKKYNLRVEIANKIVANYKNEFINDVEIMTIINEMGTLMLSGAVVKDWRQNTYLTQINYNALIEFDAKIKILETKVNTRRVERGISELEAKLALANDKILDLEILMSDEVTDELVTTVSSKLEELSDIFLSIGCDLEKYKNEISPEKYTEYNLKYNDLMQSYLTLMKKHKEMAKNTVKEVDDTDKLYKVIDDFGLDVNNFNFRVNSLYGNVTFDTAKLFEDEMSKLDERYNILINEIEEKHKNKLIDDNQYDSMLKKVAYIEEKLTETRLKLNDPKMYMMNEGLIFDFLNGKIDGFEKTLEYLEKRLDAYDKRIKDRKARKDIDGIFKRLEKEMKSLERQLEENKEDEVKYNATKERLNNCKKRLGDLGKKYRRKCPLLVRAVKSAKNFFKKYKKQLLILAGLVAFAMMAHSVIIPAIMHGNIMIGNFAPALRGPINAINNLLGGLIGAAHLPNDLWILANGVPLNTPSASASLLKGLAISGIGNAALLAPVIVMVKKLIEKMNTVELKQKLIAGKDKVVDVTKKGVKNATTKVKQVSEEISDKNKKRKSQILAKKEIKSSIKNLINDYVKSGLTAEEYCKDNNINGVMAELLMSYEAEMLKNRENFDRKKGGK